MHTPTRSVVAWPIALIAGVIAVSMGWYSYDLAQAVKVERARVAATGATLADRERRLAARDTEQNERAALLAQQDRDIASRWNDLVARWAQLDERYAALQSLPPPRPLAPR